MTIFGHVRPRIAGLVSSGDNSYRQRPLPRGRFSKDCRSLPLRFPNKGARSALVEIVMQEAPIAERRALYPDFKSPAVTMTPAIHMPDRRWSGGEIHEGADS